MFTGLIEELGGVEKIRRKENSVCLTFRASTVLGDISVGASIAVNGACLTIADFGAESFSVDVVPETLKKTTLSRLCPGEKVNLERAVKVGDRLGGHLVTGHIDGLGEIKKKRRQGNGLTLKVSIPQELTKYLVPQGSIAVDGISLTVVKSDQNSFTVAIIPHTAGETTLRLKPIGSYVNIEVDSLSKYVEQLINSGKPKRGRITTDFLREQGFK